METRSEIRGRLESYLQAVPAIIQYQIASKLLIAIWLFLLGGFFQELLRSSGKVAVTSGDWKFLFTTWQGLLILVLGMVSLFIYVAFDLNARISLSKEIVLGEPFSIKECVRDGLRSIGKLINLRGAIIVIYIALIAPILGIGVSISVTEGLYIPTFISSFIESSVLYSALAGIAVIVFLSVGIANLFILHGIVIDGLSVKDAGALSAGLMKRNWKDYLLQNILCILTITIILAAIAAICLFIPLKLIGLLPASSITRMLTIFFVIAGVLISVLADLLGVPFYLLKMTQLFFSYKQGREVEFGKRMARGHNRNRRILIVFITAVLAAVVVLFIQFDRIFPSGTDVRIIAHRAGGVEGNENTVSGLEAAIEAGAYGSEIDIQRTKDGHYILNHDDTFKRVAGVKKKPGEMTLAEIRKLDISGDQVPTFEEMLEASRGRIVLFTELKGKTADKKMADDAVRIIKKYKMEDECVLISLKYDLIDYIETNYPEIQTGFLLFASFGNTSHLNCDYIGLEEESVTSYAISSIHGEKKQVLVWTANSADSQKYFLCTKVDGLITDEVKQAERISSDLEKRSDLDRMVDMIKTVL